MNGRLSPLPSLNTRPAQLQRLVRRFFKTSSERTKFPRASEQDSLERAKQIPSLEQFSRPRSSNSEKLGRQFFSSSPQPSLLRRFCPV